MKFLLDTHLLLWAAGEPRRLSKQARALIENPDNELLFSAASLWEVAIKRSLGRKDLNVDARLLRRGLLDNEYRELPIISDHVVATESLPLLHKGSFRQNPGGTGDCRRHHAADHRFPGVAVPGAHQDSVEIIQF